jgi:hypothetical protein
MIYVLRHEEKFNEISRSEVELVVKHCDHCQKMKNSRKTNRRPIRHFDIGKNIIGSLAIDICGPIKYHNCNYYFVVGIERISRFLWTLLLPNMPQSQELVDYVKGINKVLAIQTVHTDQGSI